MGAIQVEKVRSGTFKHVESELYAYHDTVKEIHRLREEILHTTPYFEKIGGGRSNLSADPVANKATLLMTHKMLVQMEDIVDAIRYVYNGLTSDKQKLIRLKYWTRPQSLTWEGIAQKIPISERMALLWRREVVHVIASRLGWK